MFPLLIAEDNAFAKSDILFYGYESLRTQARLNALRLHTALDTLGTKANDLIRRSLPFETKRDEPFSYERIVLVAHSLGAVIARQAVLDAYKNNDAWADRVELILFSPAHMGSHLRNLLKETIYKFLPSVFIGPIIEYRYQVLKDLEPRSDFLMTLREATQKQLPSSHRLKAKTIVHASQERVVETSDFLIDDPTPILIEGRAHTNICKPNRTYSDPVDIVKGTI
jgi:hypothetical protein